MMPALFPATGTRRLQDFVPYRERAAATDRADWRRKTVRGPASMTDEDPNAVLRRALGLAIQILEELPDDLRPRSNLDDMKAMLGGRSTGRDGLIQTEAVATALAHLSQRALGVSPYLDRDRVDNAIAGLNNRMHDFRAIFDLAKRCDAGTLALKSVKACSRLGAGAGARP
jgi:hypothetical protein